MNAKDIKAAFEKLYWIFDSKTVNYAQRLLDECKREEKGHRGFAPNFRGCHTSNTISIAHAARLFAVKRVAEYLSGEPYPQGQQYLHMQTSCFIAAGIADEFGGDIRLEWSRELIAELAKLDYTEFVKVKQQAA